MVGCDYDYDFKSFLCTVGFKGCVDFTVVKGELVVKDGKLCKVNEGDIIPKAREVEELYLYGKK